MKLHHTVFLFSSVAFMPIMRGYAAQQLPLGASDLVNDSRFDQYKPSSQRFVITEWNAASAKIDLEYEGQDSQVGSAIPFKIIKDEMGEHDALKILAVNLVFSETLEIGSMIEVVGTYELKSVDAARIGLSITSAEKGGRHKPAPGETMDITKGKGSFHLIRKAERHGGIHLSIYPKEASGRYGQSTSRLYFLELNQ